MEREEVGWQDGIEDGWLSGRQRSRLLRRAGEEGLSRRLTRWFAKRLL